MTTLQNSRVSDEDIIGQSDPFYAECRAYGQIASKPRKIPIAVACHGFVSIPAIMESTFEKKFKVKSWNRPDDESSEPLANRQPFRALVKDLVEIDPPITKALLKRMLRDLKALNRLKIYVMDIAIRNYKGGKIVDFSSSWTEPNFMFREDVRSKIEIRQFRGEDAFEFDEMIGEMNVSIWNRASRNEEYIEKLRPRRKTA
jgi:Kinetochore Sim4 complex subunit FTA2